MNSFPMFDTASLPRIIGHRGAKGSAPENTLASIRKAAELGVAFVEFDINLAGNREIVVFHDVELDRCTDGNGLLVDHSYAELSKLDAGSHYSDEFAGEKIPRLSDAIELLAALNIGANIEIKSVEGNEEATVLAVAGIIRQHWPRRLPILLSSFNELVIRLLSRHLADLACGLLVREVQPDWREKLREFGVVSFHCRDDTLQKRHVDDAKRAGYPVLVYTVNSRTRARQLLEWGVASVISDHPERMIDL